MRCGLLVRFFFLGGGCLAPLAWLWVERWKTVPSDGVCPAFGVVGLAPMVRSYWSCCCCCCCFCFYLFPYSVEQRGTLAAAKTLPTPRGPGCLASTSNWVRAPPLRIGGDGCMRACVALVGCDGYTLVGCLARSVWVGDASCLQINFTLGAIFFSPPLRR